MNSGFANWIAQDCSTVSQKLSKSSVCKFSGYALACNIMACPDVNDTPNICTLYLCIKVIVSAEYD